MTGPEAATDADARLARYLDELYLWNRRVNLTAVPRAQAESRHTGEARRLLAAAEPARDARVVDIGAGGGVPGIVMAILRPDLHLTLVEADRRRAGFLIHVAAVCACSRVTVVSRRAEELGHDPAHRGRYDVAVSRATAAAPALCELALPSCASAAGCWRWYPTPRPTRGAPPWPRPSAGAARRWPSPPAFSPSPRWRPPPTSSPGVPGSPPAAPFAAAERSALRRGPSQSPAAGAPPPPRSPARPRAPVRRPSRWCAHAPFPPAGPCRPAGHRRWRNRSPRSDRG